MATGALDDVVVLELASGAGGPYCGKLLADLGAQVIKVEPPEGDAIRRAAPLVSGDSAFFNYLDANKLGVCLGLDDARIAELARHADIVIHSERGLVADELDKRLRAASSSAVIVSLTPYGRDGERAGWEASPLTEWATGGFHYFAGDPAREPLALPGYQAEYHGGLHAAIAGLAGLWHARVTGEGQRIEVSRQEATLSDHCWLTTMWTHMGQVQRRTGSAYVRCADGHVFLFGLVPYPNLFVLMERFDLLEDEELQVPLVWVQRFPEIHAALSAWAATRTKQEIYHAAQELRIAMSPVNTMADVAKSEQLAAREWFGEVEAGGKRFQAPGFPYRLTETPCTSRTAAPKLGEHTGEVLSHSFHWANAGVVRGGANATEGGKGAGPLAGLRLIEITGNWAGPIAGRHFGDLGADVIKIELATKPATRALIYVGDDLWPDHYHRSGYFNKLNRSKRAICLDLSKPAGRDVFLQLVARADVVLENNAARVMGQLGLDYDTLRGVNPSIVMCSMSGFGATGPERNYSAYGSNIETISGLATLMGYGPGDAFPTGTFYADPVTGNHGAIAILAALLHRRRSGQGQWIDMALLEAVAPLFAQQFLEFTVTGALPQPDGNRSPEYSPQGVYPSFGKDCWLALTVRDEHDWQALCRVIARPDMSTDDSLDSVEGRRSKAGSIDEAIRGWSATLDHDTAATELQAAGVPAAPVMANWEVASDNHLHERGFFVPIRHPVAGTHSFPGFAWRFEATPAVVQGHAPLFAQHNREVFEDLLSLSPEQIANLYAAGVTADAPSYAVAFSL